MALTTEDRLDILDLSARYNHAIDYGDAEGWADCFLPDGAFGSTWQTRFAGRAALVDFARQAAAADTKSLHWTTNWVIEGDGERLR